MGFRSFWQNKSWQYNGLPGATGWRLSQYLIAGLMMFLLASGASAESLLDAAAIGDIRDVKLYLAQGADVNAMDADSFRPLHWAAFGGYQDIVELLVTNGADLEVQNADGLTPLHTAVLAGHPQVVKHLIAIGANTATTTRRGNTARDMAVIRGRTAIVDIFDEQPALTRYPTIASRAKPATVANGAQTVKTKPVVVPQTPPRQMASLTTTAPPPSSHQNPVRLRAVVKPTPPALSTPDGGFLIQLASVKSESAAESAWARYQKRFPDLLGTYQLRVERVDLVQKGIFYRVRTGPFTDKDQAEAVCRYLKAHKKACLIITP